jgi:hypothetical protein
MKQEIVGQPMPGRLNEYIEQTMPHYLATAKSQRHEGGIMFQARFETDKIRVYGSPQSDFDDAVATLELVLDSLVAEPKYKGLLPAARPK